MTLANDLEHARAEVARLERVAATAACREFGCDWKVHGYRACCCEGLEDGEFWVGGCSIPVCKCTRCGDFDYGENAEAATTIEDCEYRPSASGALNMER